MRFRVAWTHFRIPRPLGERGRLAGVRERRLRVNPIIGND
jgi:hypothetical protein